MPNSENRKLSAVLFADIVGYTAMMQSDEPKALTSLQKFKSNLEVEVPILNGEIIQFYGDGVLCVFNSSVDAVACAKNLQTIFQSEPKVPVRIGLHAGDIVFREGNVFGDAVNIASRVESMGIPGSVLLSSNIRNQIKNQPDFKLENLGKFEFKNVQEGMTVYALANEGLTIPKQGAIKGKFKESIAKKSKLSQILSGFGLVILLGVAMWYFSKSDDFNNKSSINENEIAVFPFEVKGSQDIQYLGEGIVDLIANQLDEIPNIQGTDPNTVFSQLQQSPITRQPKEAAIISQNLGASKFILGTIVEINNLLNITAFKYNTKGELLARSTVKGDKKEDLLTIIDALIRGIVAKELETSGEEFNSLAATLSEDMESLKTYLNGEQAYRAKDYENAYKLFVKATEIDSTFGLAWMRVADAAKWDLESQADLYLITTNAIQKWGIYKEDMPKKWQEFYEATLLFQNGDKEAFDLYHKLIRRYGAEYAFLNGLGEYCLHINPIYGKSELEAKTYFNQSIKLNKTNLEEIYHLVQTAYIEKDIKEIQKILTEFDVTTVYPFLKMYELLLKDSVSISEINDIMNHPYFNPFVYTVVLGHGMAFECDNEQLFDKNLVQQMLKISPSEEFDMATNVTKMGALGKEKEFYEAWQNLGKINGMIPISYRKVEICMPATLMADSKFTPFSTFYEELFLQTKDGESPWEIYAAIKYAIALNKDKEVTQLKNKLLALGKDAQLKEKTKYFDYSIKAFEARRINNNELALLYVDSAFQHPYNYIDLQLSCYDKHILSAEIYAEQGEFEKAIAFYENGMFLPGTELYRGYIAWQLSKWYEATGNISKSLEKCNLLLNSFQNCDDKYKHWVTEVKERRDRLQTKIL